MTTPVGPRCRLPLPWTEVYLAVLSWDQRVHAHRRVTEREWAITLRDRVLVWTPLLCGLQPFQLVALPVAGQMTELIRRDRRGAPRGVVRLGTSGFADLVRAYVDSGRPRLQQPGLPSPRFLLNNHGRPFTLPTLTSRFSKRLAPDIFGTTPVTLTHLRRAWLALLSDGLRFRAADLRAAFGIAPQWLTPAAAGRPGPGSCLELLARPAVLPEAVHVLNELRAWLRRLAGEFGETRSGDEGSASERPLEPDR